MPLLNTLYHLIALFATQVEVIVIHLHLHFHLSSIKKLAGQTMWYGLSTIAGRFLNYLLVPFYTRIFLPEEYGIVSYLYSFMAFANVVYTYGMETSFFYFTQNHDKQKVYNTAVTALLLSSAAFSIIIILGASPIASLMRLSGHTNLIIYTALILAFDAVTSIPFAGLRKENRPRKFALIKIIGIAINVVLNFFFLWFCPLLLKSDNLMLHNFADAIYNPALGIAYIFIAGVLSSGLTILFLYREYFAFRFTIDKTLFKTMILYSLPLLVAGLAGMVNETLDRIILNYLIHDPHQAMHQQGVYGACYKLSILMTLGIQMFRYAAEPFFFSRMKQADGKQVYALVMKYFVAACSLVFLMVVLYLDIFKYFIGKNYWEGLHVVPILLLANLCLGVYINQSMWYKLSGQTKYGMWFSLLGAVITIVLNLILIPFMGYTGAAWTTLACYTTMMIASYIIGQKYYPITYQLKTILTFIVLAIILYATSAIIQHQLKPTLTITLSINTLLMAGFVFYLIKKLKVREIINT